MFAVMSITAFAGWTTDSYQYNTGSHPNFGYDATKGLWYADVRCSESSGRLNRKRMAISQTLIEETYIDEDAFSYQTIYFSDDREDEDCRVWGTLTPGVWHVYDYSKSSVSSKYYYLHYYKTVTVYADGSDTDSVAPTVSSSVANKSTWVTKSTGKKITITASDADSGVETIRAKFTAT